MRWRTGSDDTLIHAAACGDTYAFAALERRHRGWVLRLLQSFTKDADEAEDLTQEVFARVHRHAGAYRARGAFVAWLKRIAINVGNAHLQRRSPIAFVPLTEWEKIAADPDADPLRAVLLKGLHEEVRAAITALPEEQRSAILLRYFGSLSVSEIARMLNCPEGTVKSRLFHGIRRIRDTVTIAWKSEGKDQ